MISPRLKRVVEQAYERSIEQQEVYADLLERMLEQTAQSAPSSEELKTIVAESMRKHTGTLEYLRDK